jgi:uncharacterized protein YfbU (UPF0304 family)
MYPNEADSFAVHRKALEDGYALQYEVMFEHIYDEMSEEECREVLDILDMYRAITFSFQRLEEAGESLEGLTRNDIGFQGFDGNNETKQMSYTQYFVHDLGRFQELTDGNKYKDFNSHFPTMDLYRRMLDEWRKKGKSFELSGKDMLNLLYPDGKP